MAVGTEATLADVPLFSDLDGEELEEISRRAVVRSFPRNALVVHEGDDSDSLYVVLSGRVKVFLGDEEGREVIINTLGPGDYFGELALFDSAPRSASVMTMEQCRLGVLSRSDFEQAVDRNGRIALKVMRGLIQRLRHLTEDVKSLALMDVYGRVARLLLQLATEKDGVQVIEEPLTQQDIASRVGASREMVSRIFKDLRAGGYIETEGRKLVIRERLPRAW